MLNKIMDKSGVGHKSSDEFNHEAGCPTIILFTYFCKKLINIEGKCSKRQIMYIGCLNTVLYICPLIFMPNLYSYIENILSTFIHGTALSLANGSSG